MSAADTLGLFTLRGREFERLRHKMQKAIECRDGDTRIGMLETMTNDTLLLIEAALPFEVTEYLATDVVINPAGLESTAYNSELQDYMGLHIDNHEELPLSGRANAFHLVCVNFGTRDRFLSVIPWNAAALLRACNANHELAVSHEARFLLNRFLASEPNPSIWRFSIPPGTGYVLCTQNYAHDGSTNISGEQDVALLIGGRLSHRALQ